MANQRSILPKIRPATQGSQRPKIRPVKPSAPPAPPRRHSSGIRNPDEQSPQTQGYGEPPTMAAARARIHEIARELSGDRGRGNYNDETQGRIEEHDLAAAHAAYDRQFNSRSPGDGDQDAETGYGQQNYYAPPPAAGDYHAPPQHYAAPEYAPEYVPDPLDQLPALGHHEHYDAEYQHQDPMTALRPAYDEVLERHEERVRSDRPLPEDDSSGEFARREQRYSPPPPATYSAASNSYDPAAYEANYPKARRDEAREGGSYRPSHRGEDNRSQVPKSDHRQREDRGSDRREEGRSFRRDDFPREGSYRDEPRREEPRREEPRREEPRDEGRSYRREESRREEPRREEPREEGRSYRREESRREEPRPQADHTRAEGSGAKHKDDDYNDPPIPAPARVPAEMRVPDNFVVGVQPIRTPSMGASAAYPQPQAVITPGYGPPTAAASPHAMGGVSGGMGMPVITMPPMMAPMQPQMMPMSPMTSPMQGMPGSMHPSLHVRAHTSMRPGHIPQPTEVEEAQQSSKVGRFAWFVFGAAFGIFFAFAATGWGFGKKEAEPAPNNFPPSPTLTQQPVQVAPPQQPAVPPQVAPVAPPPVAVAPPPQQLAPQVAPQQQPLAPQVGQPMPPPGVMVAPNQNVGPIVPAPGGPQVQQQQPQGQPQPQAQQPPQRGGGAVRGGGGGARPPRNNGGGRRPAAQNNNDNDEPAPSVPKKKEASPSDILGDGI